MKIVFNKTSIFSLYNQIMKLKVKLQKTYVRINNPKYYDKERVKLGCNIQVYKLV